MRRGSCMSGELKLFSSILFAALYKNGESTCKTEPTGLLRRIEPDDEQSDALMT